MAQEEILRMPVKAVLSVLCTIVGALVAFIFISLSDEVGALGDRVDKTESKQAVIENDVEHIKKKVGL